MPKPAGNSHEEPSKFNRKAQRIAERDLKAERATLQELFYDLYLHRGRVYKMNFWRGIWFGFGVALGGSIIIAAAIWLLSLFQDVPGGVGDFVRWLMDAVTKR